MKSKLSLVVLIIALAAIIGITLVGCVGSSSRSSSGPVVRQGVLYLGTQDGKMIALDAQNGRQTKSPYELSSDEGGGFGCASGGGAAALYSTAIVSSDTIYIGDYDGNVWAFNLNLVPAWNSKYYKTKSHIIGNLVLSDGTLYFGAANKKVYALDASTGQLRWEPYKTKGKIWSTPTIADGIIYVGTLDHHMYAINADTGVEIPSFSFKADGAIVTAPIIQGNTIYVGANDRYIYALNKADGSIKWRFKGNQWFWAQPVFSDGIIYAVTLSGQVYAIADRGNTYELLWQYNLDTNVNAPPLLAKVGEQTLLFVGGHNGELTALKADIIPQGELRVEWSYEFKSAIDATLSTNDDNTIIYAYTRNHLLHARDTATSGFIFTFDTDDMALVFK